MKKLISIILTVAFLTVFGAIYLIGADCPEKVTITKTGKSKAPVTFTHKAHADKFGCKKCHHTWDEKSPVKKCTECHKDAADGKKLDAKTAFHNTCKGCHTDMSKKGEKTGPTKCADCHKK